MTLTDQRHIREPIVVVGSGVAGGLAALLLSRHEPVVLLTKGELVGGSTALAQGGVAAAIGGDDSWQRHRAETIAAAAGLADPAVATRVCKAAPDVVRLLASLGVPFDRGHGGGLARGREGAHSRNRVVHAGGDATGAHIAATIAAAIVGSGCVDVHERCTVRQLIVSEAGAEGLVAVDHAGQERTLPARAVVLATGGYCGLYERTTVPLGAVGDGIALAAAAGAAVADLEMVQFHPTAIALDRSPLPLATEALRGAGARLLDAEGRRFMADVHPLAELGPRDVVARAIYEQPNRMAWLDLPDVGADEAARRFPTVAAACTGAGLVLGEDPIPVTPAAHYAIGGVLADVAGRTTVPGLFAIGECAATGLHGANRLASNSLLEGAAMAVECASTIGSRAEWPEGLRVDPVEPPTPAAGPTLAARARLRAAMWEGMGIVRDEAGLGRTAAIIADLADEPLDATAQTMHGVARLCVAAARARTESRGAHWRQDHPHPDPTQARRRGWVGTAQFEIDLATGTRPARRERVKEAA